MTKVILTIRLFGKIDNTSFSTYFMSLSVKCRSFCNLLLSSFEKTLVLFLFCPSVTTSGVPLVVRVSVSELVSSLLSENKIFIFNKNKNYQCFTFESF